LFHALSNSRNGACLCADREGGIEKMEAQLMTVREVAKYLRLKPLTIYRMAKANRIPYRKTNRPLKFDKEEIDQWSKWGNRR
jgi:excisionase family DNA binding protein